MEEWEVAPQAKAYKELAHQAYRQLGNGVPIIDVAWSQAERQKFALVIDDQVQLEAEEPAHRGFAMCSSSGKDAMLMDASRMTDGKRGRVDEDDVRGF